MNLTDQAVIAAEEHDKLLRLHYRIWYDAEADILNLETFHTMTGEEVEEAFDWVYARFPDAALNCIIADLSQASSEPITRESRKVWNRKAENLTYRKVAVIVANPMTRMLAKIALAAAGKSHTAKFFKSRAEALPWLRE